MRLRRKGESLSRAAARTGVFNRKEEYKHCKMIQYGEL